MRVAGVVEFMERKLLELVSIEVGTRVRVIGPTRSKYLGSEGVVTRCGFRNVEVCFGIRGKVVRRFGVQAVVACGPPDVFDRGEGLGRLAKAVL